MRLLSWRTGRIVTGVAGLAGAAAATYVSIDPGARREVKFWSVVGPCVARYVWLYRTVPDAEVRRPMAEQLHARYAKPIVNLFMELGGPYVKLGQYLSVRPEIVPDAYRTELKKLQSDVPGKTFDEIRPVLGDLEARFASIEKEHFGAASIGQVHRATLHDGRSVAVKVQYPDVKWKFEVDLRCIASIIKLGSTLGLIDRDGENAVRYFEELRSTSMNELDFALEKRNLDRLHATAGVHFADVICIPESIPELCTDRVITMTFLEGPKLEDEVLRRLRAVGIDRGSTDIRQFLRDQAANVRDSNERAELATAAGGVRGALVALVGALGPNNVLWLARTAQKARDTTMWACCEVVGWVEAIGCATSGMSSWRETNLRDLSTRHTEAETTMWLHTLLDVHGYEIFQCPLFNSDPHPGNIIVMPDGRLGLIDYGQCKAFRDERTKRSIAGLIVAVADKGSDAEIAEAFRSVGIRTANSSDFFTASLARMMFGHLSNEMMRREWHHELHAQDRVVHFPSEMLFVYRVAALLRGLGLALHMDLATANAWRSHAAALLNTQTASVVDAVDELQLVSVDVATRGAETIPEETIEIATPQPVTVQTLMARLEDFVDASRVNLR